MADTNIDLKGRTIILGVTGSIAAYKAADITSRLTEAGATVYPVMTESACRFIQPLTLQVLSRNPASSDLWKEGEGRQSFQGAAMQHLRHHARSALRHSSSDIVASTTL